jgi:hypothetical protein
MAFTYIGPYVSLLGAEHEGYVAVKLPDGTLTDRWSGEYESAEPAAFVAACSCGWTGDTAYLPGGIDSPGHDEAEEAWAREHIRPLVDQHAQGWSMWSKEVAQRAAAIAENVPADRLEDAATELGRLADDIETRRRIVQLLIGERRERHAGHDTTTP